MLLNSLNALKSMQHAFIFNNYSGFLFRFVFSSLFKEQVSHQSCPHHPITEAPKGVWSN